MPLWCVKNWDILLKVAHPHTKLKKCTFSIKLHTSYTFVSTGAVAFGSAHFGAGAGPIHLDNVDCSGSENHLINCSHANVNRCYTGHSEDAGVRCQGKLHKCMFA